MSRRTIIGDTKPHLRKRGLLWVCGHQGRYSTGSTPKGAYDNLQRYIKICEKPKRSSSCFCFIEGYKCMCGVGDGR